jgi:glycerol-3-phosphate dehydrogenase (NAD(P)+)
MAQLAVIGGGSWGTALGIVLAPRFEQVNLWVYETDLAERMAETSENDIYLPGFILPGTVVVTPSLEEALAGSDIVIGVTPSHHLRRVFAEALEFLSPSMMLVSATKGLETGTLMRMSEVLTEVVRPRFEPEVAVLSGPTFAREIAAGDPAAVAISSTSAELAHAVQSLFSGPRFRLYRNDDPVGVEVGAALKNVIAIGAGICQGLGLGNNTTAALITRGLAEISRLAVAMGGNERTLAGLAGLGDLVLTCTGDLSRNRRVGMELAKGRKLPDILESMRMVAEGVQTTYAAVDLARKHEVDLPIISQMYQVLHLGKDPRDAVRELMERSLKGE